MTRLCVFIFFCLSCVINSAEQYIPTYRNPFDEPWRWQEFPELNSLAYNCMAQAPDGDLWFGGDNGLAHYNGMEWTYNTIGPGNEQVRTIIVTPQGNLYAGTRIGLFRKHEDGWRRVFPPKPFNIDARKIVQSSDSSLWVATVWGALRIRDGEMSFYTGSENYSGLKELFPDITVYDESQLFNPQPPTQHSARDLSAQWKGAWDPENLYLFIEVVDDRLVNDSPQMWNEDGVEIYIDTQNNKAMRYDENDFWYSIVWGDSVITEAAHNKLQGVEWNIAETSYGYNLELKIPWQTINCEPEIGHRIGFDVQVNDDDDGGSRDSKRSWFTIEDNSWNDPRLFGTVQLHGPGRANFSRISEVINIDGVQESVWRQIKPSPINKPILLTATFHVTDILEDQSGTIWIGFQNGTLIETAINVKQKNTKRTVHFSEPIVDKLNARRLLQARDGRIWTISEHEEEGVSVYDGKQWISFNLLQEGGSNENFSIVETSDHSIWVSSIGMLHQYDKGTWRIFDSDQLPLPSNELELMQTTDGSLWIGGHGNQVVRQSYLSDQWVTLENLHFQFETVDGHNWYLTHSGQAVLEADSSWTRYDASDGLIDTPILLMQTRAGDIIAVGSDDHAAAVAMWRNGEWEKMVFPEFSWAFDYRSVHEDKNGNIWLGSVAGFMPERGQSGGILRLSKTQNNNWQTNVMRTPYHATAIGETANDTLWIGTNQLFFLFDSQYTDVVEPSSLNSGILYLSKYAGDDLWVATRAGGLLHRVNGSWTEYGIADGLAGNVVSYILQDVDGSIWAATDKGISRFDGTSWTTYALPSEIRMDIRGGSLKLSNDSSLWINKAAPEWYDRASPVQKKLFDKTDFYTIHYTRDRQPPETNLTSSLEDVSSDGNTIITWSGADMWRVSPDNQLQYSYRLDDQPWSPFTDETNRVLFSLPDGMHTFQVRARDRDFNIDPTPASLTFKVHPPVYKEIWFLSLVGAFLLTVSIQTVRILKRDKKLQSTNILLTKQHNQLETTNTKLSQANQALVYERQLLQSLMDNAPDFIFFKNRNSEYVRTNRAHARKILGLKRAKQAVGRTDFDFLPESHARAMFKKEQQLMANGEPIVSAEIMLSPKNSDNVWLSESKVPMRSNDGNVVGLISISRDITKLKEMEQALRERERSYRTLFEKAIYPILFIDEKGRFIDGNDAALAFFECDPAQLKQTTIFQSDHNKNSVATDQSMKTFWQQGGTTEIDYHFGDRTKTLEWTFIPVTFFERQIIFGIGKDVSERKAAEKKLYEYQERLRSLTSELSLSEEKQRRMFAIELHDRIGQSLATSKIKLGALQRALQNKSMTPDFIEIRDLIEQTIQDTRSLTLELSPPVLYELGFLEAVRWLSEETQERFNIRTTFKTTETMLEMSEDMNVLLFQAVRELLHNATKHAKASQIDVFVSRKNGNASIIVKDNGIGFNKNHQHTHASKTGGFGLFSIRERLTYLNGDLHIESNPGEGTQIELVAPLEDET